MKQFAWPSKDSVMGSPRTNRRKFRTKISAAKCATEPAFDVGTSLASPTAKISGYALARSVCRSTGT